MQERAAYNPDETGHGSGRDSKAVPIVGNHHMLKHKGEKQDENKLARGFQAIGRCSAVCQGSKRAEMSE